MYLIVFEMQLGIIDVYFYVVKLWWQVSISDAVLEKLQKLII